MKGLFAAASVSALLIASPVWAQTTANPHKLSSQDQEFIQKAGAGNLAEAQLGQLAEQKGATQAVKEFGRWMATDHTFANQRLMKIAQHLQISEQPKLTQQQKELQQRLEGASGAQFDQQYLQAMVTDHQEDIQAFKKQAQDGRNRAIKNYAESLTPVLEQHLAEAQELAGAAGMASRTGSTAEGMSGSSLPPNAETRQLNQRELNQMRQNQMQQNQMQQK